MPGSWTALALVALLEAALVVLAIVVTESTTRAALGRPRTEPGRHARPRPSRGVFRPAAARRGLAGKGAPAGKDVAEPVRLKRAAVIVNPTKFAGAAALAGVRARLERVCREQGWDVPLVLETTAEDPGTGQAREALQAGVDVVCPLGGDGTIRAVAAALAGTSTPIGLLPGGTGNLLARNLGAPVDSIEAAMVTACTGRNRPIDVGWLRIDPPEGDTTDDEGHADEPQRGPELDAHLFLVMAGLGYDAAIMEETSEASKKRFGWPAYVLTGLRELGRARFPVRVTVDGEPPVGRRVKTVLVGNCGRVQGGVALLPEAKVDDGRLDALLLAPKGPLSWLEIATSIITRGATGSSRMKVLQGSRMDVRTPRPQAIEIDGDAIGTASHVIATVRRRALLVRVEALTQSAAKTDKPGT